MNKQMRIGLGVMSALALGACAQDESGLGQLEVALTSEASHFRLTLHKGQPGAGERIFDSTCLALKSQSYALTDLPVGDNYSILFEGFSSGSCAESARIEVGFRGGVSISEGGQPYFHVQSYSSDAVTALPEDINLSSAFSKPVDSCGEDTCGANELCHEEESGAWCVPTCSRDADCSALHPRATCQDETAWCVLTEPFPLNLSESRSFGAAATLNDGDVVLIGGLRSANNRLTATTHAFERFDAQTGLFTAFAFEGVSEHPGGAFGSADLGKGRVLTVGGTQSVEAKVESNALTWSVMNANALSKAIHVYDFQSGKVAKGQLETGLLLPSVLVLDESRFLVVGGLTYSEAGLKSTNATHLCTVGADAKISCEASVTLEHGRVAPALSCLDNACEDVLVVGGSRSALAERLSLKEESSSTLSSNKGPALEAAHLCGDLLVAGAGEGFQKPQRFTLTDGAITWSEVDGSMGAWAAFVASDCTIAGGLQAGKVLSVVTQLDESLPTVLSAALNQPRFGALAASIGEGPLKGMTLFAGGLTMTAEGALESVRGAEMLAP